MNDATHRAAAEVALRPAQTGARVGVWSWDIAADRVFWSDSLYALHGVGSDGFDGTVAGFAKLVHPDDRDEVARRIDGALHDDAPYEVEFRALRPDGGVVWLYTHAQVERDSGRPVRMHGVTLDITERKEAERSLRESEAMFRDIADGAPVMTWLTDETGRCAYISRSWYEYTGVAAGGGLDLAWTQTLHPEEREDLVARFTATTRRASATTSSIACAAPTAAMAGVSRARTRASTRTAATSATSAR